MKKINFIKFEIDHEYGHWTIYTERNDDWWDIISVTDEKGEERCVRAICIHFREHCINVAKAILSNLPLPAGITNPVIQA